MAWNKALSLSLSSLPVIKQQSPASSFPYLSLLSTSRLSAFSSLPFRYPATAFKTPPSLPFFLHKNHLCRATETEYVFPDPIPEFAESETEKFRDHMLKRLSKKDIFGDSVDEIVGICTEIFNNFLHTEYGGPGTLLVVPFIDMADTLNERDLPGGPQAARAAVVWAQKHVDKDWDTWTGGDDDSAE